MASTWEGDGSLASPSSPPSLSAASLAVLFTPRTSLALFSLSSDSMRASASNLVEKTREKMEEHKRQRSVSAASTLADSKDNLKF